MTPPDAGAVIERARQPKATAGPEPDNKQYTLLDADRKPYRSSAPGQFGPLEVW